VAEGMRHLAEKRLVHGDLKPQNILMCSATATAGELVPQVLFTLPCLCCRGVVPWFHSQCVAQPLVVVLVT